LCKKLGAGILGGYHTKPRRIPWLPEQIINGLTAKVKD
jgi:hypothetical protein